VLSGLDAGLTHQEVAEAVLGVAARMEPWANDGGLRSKARRRIAKATDLRDGGYRAFLAPRRRRRRAPA
jgi:hypothetical protein